MGRERRDLLAVRVVRLLNDPLTAALERLADGDRSAFDEVYAAVWPLVLGVCTRVVGDPVHAEDTAQAVLLRVFERVGEFDPARGSARAWIVTTAAWQARSTRRDLSRRPVEAPVDGPAPGLDPEATVAGDELRAVLAELVDALNPADRAVVLAALDRGARPDVPPATFRKRLQRAIARLRRAWEDR